MSFILKTMILTLLVVLGFGLIGCANRKVTSEQNAAFVLRDKSGTSRVETHTLLRDNGSSRDVLSSGNHLDWAYRPTNPYQRPNIFVVDEDGEVTQSFGGQNSPLASNGQTNSSSGRTIIGIGPDGPIYGN